MLKLVPKNERKTQPANYRMMHNFCAFHLMYTLESNETLFPFRSTYSSSRHIQLLTTFAMASNDDFYS